MGQPPLIDQPQDAVVPFHAAHAEPPIAMEVEKARSALCSGSLRILP
jgi:hypothetical protein